jgi:hypothetical protein
MRVRELVFALALVSASGFVATGAWAHENDEQKVKLDDVPAAVRATLVREAKGAEILDVEVERVHGKTRYEAHVKQGDEVIGIVVDASGKFIGRHSEKNEKERE